MKDVPGGTGDGERAPRPPPIDLWTHRLPIVLMGIAALLLSALVVTVLIFLFFVEVDPIEKEMLVEVEPADRVLDRNHLFKFHWKREVCSRRSVQAEVYRAWTEELPSGQIRPVVIFANLPYELSRGCHAYDVEQNIPETLPPGRYVYESVVRYCDILGRCSRHALTPIPVVVRGGRSWPDVDPGPPSPLPSIPRGAR